MTDAEYLDWLRATGGYVVVIPTGDGRWCGIQRLLFHWTIHVGRITDRCGSHEERYCFQTFERSADALTRWAVKEFKGDPVNWHYHPMSGRRRTEEEIAADYVDA